MMAKLTHQQDIKAPCNSTPCIRCQYYKHGKCWLIRPTQAELKSYNSDGKDNDSNEND